MGAYTVSVGRVSLRDNVVMVLVLYEYICSLQKKANMSYRCCVCALVKLLSSMAIFRGEDLALQNAVSYLHCRGGITMQSSILKVRFMVRHRGLEMRVQTRFS